MKIDCYILKRDRTIRQKSVNSDRSDFKYNEGIYQILADCVNVSSHGGVVTSRPELYYVEDLPQPINYQSEESGEASAPPFLEETLIVNAIESLAGGPGAIFKFLGKIFERPAALIPIAFAFIIVAAFIQGMFTL